MAAPATQELRAEIVRLAHGGLTLETFAERAARAVNRVVPFDGVAIVACDPATAIPTGKWFENSITGADGLRVMDIELHEQDVNKTAELAASGRLAGSIGHATGGRLHRSLRHRELMRPRGLGDELRAVCVSGSRTWGVVVLHRELGRRHFGAGEVRLLASLSGEFAEAFQRTSLADGLRGGGSAPSGGEPGLLLLDDDDGIAMVNDGAAEWLDDLSDHEPGLPLVVSTVAHRARAVAAGLSDAIASARIRARSGRWVLVRGSVLSGAGGARTAVTIEPARVPELAPLIVQAYGLTERERLVTERVAEGLSTAAIARVLHLSPFTVQDHLKSIFDKLGVSTRGELVARLFLDHYEVDGRLTDPRRAAR